MLRIQMLTVCFDASGKTPSTTTKRRGKSGEPDSPVLAVAGFASQAGVWAEFDYHWESVLLRYRAAYFHAAELAYDRGAYKDGWKGEKQKKDDFQGELMEVIENCGLRKFGNVLWTEDQNKVKSSKGLSADATATPYVLCARASVDDFIAYAIGEGQLENIEYVFEKGDEEHTLRQHFKKHSYQEPIFRWKHPVELKGIVQKPFMGLQAAGWIVWEYYMSLKRVFDERNSAYPYPPERWALKRFDDHRHVPGNVIVLYKSAPFLHLLKNHAASFVDLSKSVAEATARIESAKKGIIKA
jgi:hypothetical protein